MTIFRSRGFDSLIGKGTVVEGHLVLAQNSTMLIEGDFLGIMIDGGSDKRTTLHIAGSVRSNGGTGLSIDVPNVIITGKLECEQLRCDTLAVKKGAILKATRILYRKLIVETGAVMHGEMIYRDDVPQVEAPKA